MVFRFFVILFSPLSSLFQFFSTEPPLTTTDALFLAGMDDLTFPLVEVAPSVGEVAAERGGGGDGGGVAVSAASAALPPLDPATATATAAAARPKRATATAREGSEKKAAAAARAASKALAPKREASTRIKKTPAALRGERSRG